MNYNQYRYYRWCIVSGCTNTTSKTPKKLFIRVPHDSYMRNVWLKLSNRDPKSFLNKSPLYLCEDHFNLEQDMKNYMEYKIMGSVKNVKLKANIIPTKFCCQSDRKVEVSPSTRQLILTKTQILDFAENSKLYKDYGEQIASPPKSGIILRVY